MKKKMLMIIAGILMITLASAGVVGAQALPGLLLEEEKLEATGYVDELEMDYLVVDGISYEITEDTELKEEIVVGDFVKVKYYEEEGQFIALEVELEDEEFEEFEAEGYVEEYVMGEYIIVDGVRYELTMDTEVEDEIEVGDFVKVKYYEDEEMFIALEVELEDEEYEEFEAEGYVEEYVMGEYIIVDGVRFELTMDTEIEEEIVVGDFVKVKYYEEEEQLIALEVELEDEDDDDDLDNDGTVCSGEIIHPALNGLATSFGVAYEELLPYFCEQNFGIGEIKHALETAEHEDVEMTWKELLDWRHSAGWGEIWQELGLIGKDKNKNGETNEHQEQEQQEVKSNNGKKHDNPGKGKGLDKNP